MNETMHAALATRRQVMLRSGALLGGVVWAAPTVQLLQLGAATAALPSGGPDPDPDPEPDPDPCLLLRAAAGAGATLSVTGPLGEASGPTSASAQSSDGTTSGQGGPETVTLGTATLGTATLTTAATTSTSTVDLTSAGCVTQVTIALLTVVLPDGTTVVVDGISSSATAQVGADGTLTAVPTSTIGRVTVTSPGLPPVSIAAPTAPIVIPGVASLTFHEHSQATAGRTAQATAVAVRVAVLSTSPASEIVLARSSAQAAYPSC